jgi:hypothetical protein
MIKSSIQQRLMIILLIDFRNEIFMPLGRTFVAYKNYWRCVFIVEMNCD